MRPDKDVERYRSGEDEAPQSRGDEEARLLPTEQFEFEDINLPQLACPRKSSILDNWLLSGPCPTRIQIIKPFIPSIQRYPIEFLRRRFPRRWQRVVLVAVFLVFWAVAFALPLSLSNLALPDSSGEYVVNIDCIDSLWANKNLCGLDGFDCRPFSNASFAFRCPANCAQVQVLNPHPVGPLDVVYRPLVIGDGSYRGDSFICGAAIHAGIVHDGNGGCGRITRVGQRDSFAGSNSNGIESIAFDSYFPLSFTLLADPSISCRQDPRQLLLIISLLFTATFSIFTESASWQFFTTFTAIFLHVSLVSDPPGASFHNISVLPDYISKFAERFLPAAFLAVVLYRTCVSRALQGLEAQFEKTLLWLGGFWFGALSNDTFAWLPIQRLTTHDLEQQPGAKIALGIILAIITLIVIQQAYYFWLERRLLRRLALYGLFLVGILICLAIPGLELRLHHYIFALLLIPGTAIQTRPSLLYQGILLGLFVNGIARWGFASILQTPDALRGDGAFNSLLPSINPPVVSASSQGYTIDFSWATPPASSIFDGISVLVNDVERYRGFFAEGGSAYNFTWARPASMTSPEYFRFAYMKQEKALDYTKTGAWFANGSWIAMDER